MNKVEKVSIGGYAFTLEDMVYGMLDGYLAELRRFYSDRPEGDEIMEAVEDRIAEHLLDSCGKDSVIRETDVRSIIDIIGRPQDMELGTGDDFKSKEQAQKPENGEWWKDNPQKKMMRDPEHRVIGGVCSGLATYFQVDVVIVRLIWVALFVFGIVSADRWNCDGLLPVVVCLYPIMWMIVPAPKTKKEQRIVHDAASEVTGTSDFWPVFGKVCRIFFGFVFSLAGISLMILIFVAIFYWNDVHSLIYGLIHDMWGTYPDNDNPLYLLLATFVFPAVGFLWEGIRMLFDLKPEVKWHPGLVCFLLWFASLVAFGVIYSVEFFL